jgi:tetratricopeptide (TPR) repeat protein
MRLFPGDDVPDLTAIAQEMPTPWLMPMGLPRRHRDRLGGLVARAVRRFDPRIRCVQVRWAEASLVREGRIKLPERALIWWRSDTMIEEPADVLREAPQLARAFHLLDLDRDPGVAAMGWLAPLKLSLLHKLTDALLESGLEGDVEALIDEINRVADRVVSPIDLLDFTERMVETRVAGMLLEEARLDATARLIAGRLAAGPMDPKKIDDWASLLALAARRGPLPTEQQARLEEQGLTRRDSMALPPMLDWLAIPGVQALVLARLRARVMPAGLRAVRVVVHAAEPPGDTGMLEAAEKAAEEVLEAVRRGEHQRWSRARAGAEAAKLEAFVERSAQARKGLEFGSGAEREASVLEVAARLLEFSRAPERATAALLGTARRYRLLGSPEHARRASKRAQELADKTANRRVQAGAWLEAANIAGMSDDLEGARRGYERARILYEQLGDRDGQAEVFFGTGGLAQRKSELVDASNAYRAALGLYRGLGNRLGEANALRSTGDVALQRDDLGEAKQAYEAALNLFRSVGDQLGEANALVATGVLAMRRDNLGEAKLACDTALGLFRAISSRPGEAYALQYLGDVARQRDELAEAKQAYDAALDLCRDIGDRLGEGNVLASIGILAIRRGEPLEAQKAYDAALGLHRAVGNRLGEANALGRIGDLALRNGELTESKLACETALGIYRAIGNRLGEGNVLRSLGNLALRNGDSAAAAQMLAAALVVYRGINARLGEANTIAAQADLALRTGDLPVAKEAYAAALGIYRAIDRRLGEANALRGVALLAQLEGRTDTDALRAAESLSAVTQDAHGSLVTRALLAVASPAPVADELDAIATGFSSLGLPHETCLARAIARIAANDITAAAAVLAKRSETSALALEVSKANRANALRLVLPYFAS